MSKFIELNQIGNSSVFINIDNILYATPQTKLVGETRTSVMLTNGVIIKVEENYKDVKAKLNK